jgi:hypothetical protein
LIREATTETKEQRKKAKSEKKNDPPSYESLLKSINTCSMEDRQKILKVFSQDESDLEEDF